MRKILSKKSSNNNVFKTIVRSVVIEEITTFGKGFKKELKESIGLLFKKQDEKINRLFNIQEEKINDLFEENYAKYRDDVLTKLDGAIGELKKGYEELSVHSGQHVEINDRLDKLEEIHPHGTHA